MPYGGVRIFRLMARLSDREYRALLEIVAGAAAAPANDPMPASVLETILRLGPAHTVAYVEGLPWDPARRVWAYGEYTSWTDEEQVIVSRYRFDIPLQPTPAAVGHALRVSDFMGRRVYRGLALYALAGRSHHIEYAMDYWMRAPDGIARGLVFDASRRDFSDHDRDVVEVLGAHLTRVLGRADPRLPRPPGELGLTERQGEVLAWVARGRTNEEIAAILSLSPHTVRTHVEDILDRLGVHTRSAAMAVAYGAASWSAPDHPGPRVRPAAEPEQPERIALPWRGPGSTRRNPIARS